MVLILGVRKALPFDVWEDDGVLDQADGGGGGGDLPIVPRLGTRAVLEASSSSYLSH